MTTVVTVLSVKGGVGKTVTAVHLAGYFQQYGPTLLVDGDATRSATLWSRPGRLPFRVVPERQIGLELSQARYDFMVVDTEANPPEDDFSELVNACHFAVIPATPDALGLQSALQTTAKLRRARADMPFKVLLTIVAPKPNRDGEDAMQYLAGEGIPHFRASIRRIVAFQRAVLEGVTVDKLDRTNLGWRDYADVGDELAHDLSIQVLNNSGSSTLKNAATQVLR
jgi:chromosome partitioning protein